MAFDVADRHLGGSGNIERRLQRSRHDTFVAAACRKHDGGDHSAEPVDDGCLGGCAADVDADPKRREGQCSLIGSFAQRGTGWIEAMDVGGIDVERHACRRAGTPNGPATSSRGC